MNAQVQAGVGVVGAGAWGTALAQSLASDGSKVLLWAREPELVEEINTRRTNSLFLPNATSEQLGMSTESQRDPSLDGEGLPWMMREGTPSAHLMIPINGTELSNQDWDIDR